MHFTTIVAYTNSQFNSIDSLKLLISLFAVIVTIISIVMVRKKLRITNNLSEKLNRDNTLKDLHKESNWRTRLTEIASKKQNTLDDIEVLLTSITTMYQQDNKYEIKLIDKATGKLKHVYDDKDRMDALLIKKWLQIKLNHNNQ